MRQDVAVVRDSKCVAVDSQLNTSNTEGNFKKMINVIVCLKTREQLIVPYVLG